MPAPLSCLDALPAPRPARPVVQHPRRVAVLGVEFDALTLTGAVERIVEAMQARRTMVVCTVNVATMLRARRNPRLRAYIRRADVVVADGQPIVWASRLLGDALPERIGGVDLAARLMARCARDGLRVHFLGGSSEVVAEAARRTLLEHPSLQLSHADGYFGENEAEARARAVRDADVRLVLVGMGVPRQEYFIDSQRALLSTSVAIGVGGSFDVISGRLRRAPALLQRAGLEWLVRLMQEPRRLLWRYVESNSWFIAVLLMELFRRVVGRGGMFLPLLLSASSCR